MVLNGEASSYNADVLSLLLGLQRGLFHRGVCTTHLFVVVVPPQAVCVLSWSEHGPDAPIIYIGHRRITMSSS